MEGGLVETAARIDDPDDRRIYGLTSAEVIENCDNTHAGRVKVRFSWLPGFEPWARLALVDRGVFFIPQVGDEVLVNMNRGDVSEVYVVGCLWNGKDQPPAKEQDDPKNKRMIKTPNGHKVTFDDKEGTLTITSADLKHITLTKDHIEVAIDDKATSAITIDNNGNITIKAKNSIKLDAPSIDIAATNNLTLSGSSSARIDGGSYCSIAASKIYIG